MGGLGLRGWQWLFVLEGVPPLVLSGLFWRYLPDSPADAAWLTEAERGWLMARLAAARAGRDDGGHAWARLAGVVRDPRVLMMAGVYLCQLTVLYAWAFSAPVILEGLTGWTIGGVGRFIAWLGVAGAAAMLVGASHSDRTGERTWHIAAPFLVMGAAYGAGGLLHRPLFAVVAFSVAVVAYNAMQGPLLMLPSTFFSGPRSAVGVCGAECRGHPGRISGSRVDGLGARANGRLSAGSAFAGAAEPGGGRAGMVPGTGPRM